VTWVGFPGTDGDGHCDGEEQLAVSAPCNRTPNPIAARGMAHQLRLFVSDFGLI